MSPTIGRRRALLVAIVLVALGAVVAVGIGVGGAVADTGDDAGSDSSGATLPVATVQDAQQNVSEEGAAAPVPEEGDPYFEAAAPDGSWVSYVNPRDEYRSPYLGDGSGKLCVTLVNEAGEPVVGESVPETTVTVPTGESLAWHSEADPFTVEYPLTEHYQRPLDSDQFGTDPDLAQGDGVLDSHCFEWHGLPEDETVEYGEAEIEGEYADRIELVGYVQQAHDTWETDIDPIADAEPYAAAGGGWTYQTEGSHGQIVVVLQLDGPVDATDETNGTTEGDEQDDGEAAENEADTDGSDHSTAQDGENESDAADGPNASADSDGGDEAGTDDGADGLPGFGILAAITALLALVCVRYRRS